MTPSAGVKCAKHGNLEPASSAPLKPVITTCHNPEFVGQFQQSLKHTVIGKNSHSGVRFAPRDTPLTVTLARIHRDQQSLFTHLVVESMSARKFEAIKKSGYQKTGRRGCYDNGRNCELHYRNQSGDRRGYRIRPDSRRRYGPGLEKAGCSFLIFCAALIFRSK